MEDKHFVLCYFVALFTERFLILSGITPNWMNKILLKCLGGKESNKATSEDLILSNFSLNHAS